MVGAAIVRRREPPAATPTRCVSALIRDLPGPLRAVAELLAFADVDDLVRLHVLVVFAKVSESLREPYEELLGALPDQERLNVDETGHKIDSTRCILRPTHGSQTG